MTATSTATRPLRMGMVGGGRDAFIGAVHRMAAQLDGTIEFMAGALSSTPEKSIASGQDLGLDDTRNYPSWEAMLDAERARPEGERIDLVSIVTPNHVHFPVASAFAEAGIHVVLDKPMVIRNEDADALANIVDRSGVVFAVTYNYTGYPLIKHAAELVRAGTIGEIRRVNVEYLQGWLNTPLEETGQKQAAWRTDPARAGAGCVGDIGSHSENLVSTVTGLRITELCADVSTFVPGRPIDDDANVLLRFENGARGVLSCSQIATGEENNLRLRVYGTKGALRWAQENPNELTVLMDGGARQIVTRGTPPVGDAGARATRLPSGHPEGFIEGFANLYRGVAQAIHARRAGQTPDGLAAEFPTVQDGARGVRFINRVIESGAAGGTWMSLE